MVSRFVVRILCVLLICATCVQAQETPRGGRGRGGGGGGGGGLGVGNPEDIATRTYNVSDLLRPTGDYPLTSVVSGPNLFGGGGQPPPVPVAPRAVPPIDLDSLIRLLENTIQPESWANNGGAVGRISKISSMLVITQTNQTHGAILQLLSDIRRSAGPTGALNVRATWVQTDARQILAPTSEVNDEWMSKQKTYCESQITCFNGQIVHHTSGSDKSYISDMTPIVGTNAVAFDPQIGSALSGVRMQIAPQLVPDGSDLVILDVQAEVTESAIQSPGATVISFATSGTGSAKETSTASIDRVNVLRQQFKTTTRLPLRKKVIIGGMTLEPASAEQAGRQLYLVVEIDTLK